MNIKQNLKGDVMILILSGKIMGGPDHEKFQSEIKTLISFLERIQNNIEPDH